MKLFVLMEDLKYEGERFIGAYSSVEKLTNAAGEYTEKHCHSAPELFFYEVEMDSKNVGDTIRTSKLTLKYVVEEYNESSV